MARVTAYETSDGELLRDKRSYIRYESDLLAVAALRKDIAEKVAASVAPEQVDEVTKQVQGIVDSIGINRLREIMAIVFVEKAENAGANEGSGGEGSGSDGAGAPANGEGSNAADSASGQASGSEANASAQAADAQSTSANALGNPDGQSLDNAEI